ncbi:PRC-barrel domain-containing protein [Microbacterium sp. zg-Y818]|uniref:PRC-barrel domain-containing protein n=1 Tax=unclassified Microbacterium TaxID=2609290 RepID=UPI00214A93E9|nr:MULTISPECIES: PRC-barrel domain-containing protein [unclassified Microbacterium]MCR2801901.1 PRC-barrel domain-containing protein [Microbacterium sp. zg.Y818]WIM22842.1 PRC-barrel domain-containing protein [Microbacterium sp. zg-Y818]
MISSHDIASLIGRHVVDAEGHKVGTVGQAFVDPATGNPNWVTVKTGLFGSSESFVPLEQAEEIDGELRIPYGKDAVKHAPRFDSDTELTHRQEEELYAYYALRDAPDTAGDGHGRKHEHEHQHDGDHKHSHEHEHQDGREQDHDHDHDHDHDDSSAESTDRVGTTAPAPTVDADATGGTVAPVADGGLRLRRYVVTEQVTVTVPVAREEVRLEPESPTGAAPEDGADTTTPTDR